MATETYKVLYQGQPGTSAAAIYTVPAATQAIIKQIRMVNISAAAVTIKLFQGGTADANCILPSVNLQPGEWGEFGGSLVLAATTVLAAQAGAVTSITVTVEGVEIS